MTMSDYKLKLRSKNFSNSALRGAIYLPARCVYRAGSRTDTKDIFKNVPEDEIIIEINTVKSIVNSRSKILMNKCFDKAKVPHAKWFNPKDYNNFDNNDDYEKLINDVKDKYPILAKRIYGFKGIGMVKIDSEEDLIEFMQENGIKGYYFEVFKNYSREYRIHCSQEEVFMVWRKLRKSDAENRWFFNSENCNWVGVDHELFNKPVNWDKICEDCIKALREIGLDLGSFDVRVQSSVKKNPRYILIEVNSAPALGELGLSKYKEQLIKIFNKKHEQQHN